MAPARRCQRCEIDWPSHDDFHTCAVCLQDTRATLIGKPMEMRAARSLKAHWDFEHYYRDRERRKAGGQSA